MAELGFKFGAQWHGLCFLCKAEYRPYSTAERICKSCIDRYRHHKFFRGVSDLGACFVTIVPEVDILINKEMHSGFSDILLGSETEAKDFPEILKPLFPSDPHLPCGQPVLLEAESLASFAGFSSAWVLDLSPYIWSGTLKDLRSWAVLSIAIEKNIKHLAVWTAGNAGLSIAKLVHRWNAAQRDPNTRRTVYCLVDAFAPSEIVVTLRSLQCRVAPISTGAGAVLSREQVYHVVSSLVENPADLYDNYWQVTDGWDGIGVFMYSLLARQSLYRLQSLLKEIQLKAENIYIVLPLGTGNLLLGFIRGMEKMTEKVEERSKIVAAVPYGDNMMTPFFADNHEENGAPRMRRVAPVAPKLTGFYSPLSPCLWHLTLNRDFSDPRAVEFIEVDRSSQIEAAARVFSLPRKAAVASEPSAMIAFGALKQLEQLIRDHGKKPDESAVIVVNSGFGIMGAEEQEFYTKSIFAFR